MLVIFLVLEFLFYFDRTSKYCQKIPIIFKLCFPALCFHVFKVLHENMSFAFFRNKKTKYQKAVQHISVGVSMLLTDLVHYYVLKTGGNCLINAANKQYQVALFLIVKGINQSSMDNLCREWR